MDNIDSIKKTYRTIEVQTDFEPHYSIFPPQRGNRSSPKPMSARISQSVSNFFSFGRTSHTEEPPTQETKTLLTPTDDNPTKVTKASIETKNSAPLATPESSDKSASPSPQVSGANNTAKESRENKR